MHGERDYPDMPTNNECECEDINNLDSEEIYKHLVETLEYERDTFIWESMLFFISKQLGLSYLTRKYNPPQSTTKPYKSFEFSKELKKIEKAKLKEFLTELLNSIK